MKRDILRYMALFLAALCVGGIEYFFFTSEPGERLEMASTDVWFQLRGEILPPRDVVVLGLDEKSYSALHVPLNQAWPRALHARLLRRLKDLGARRAVFDILFLHPGIPEVDAELADAMKGIPTVIGADTGSRERWMGDERYSEEELLEPNRRFVEAAEQIALVKLPEDYGFMRRFVIPRSPLTHGIPALYEAAVGAIPGGEMTPGERDMIWFYGPPGSIKNYSYYQVLDEDSVLPPDAMKDKIVFIGLNLRTGMGPEQKDSFRIPYKGPDMFGVEIQATAASNIIENKWIRRTPRLVEQLLLSLAAVALAFAIFLLRPQWSGLLIAGAALGWASGAYFSFLHGIFLPGVTLVLITAPAVYTASTLTYYIVTQRARRRVEHAFRLYLPPEMARRMRENRNALRLGGENVWATAIFTDIGDFTPLSENMRAMEVSNMLNDYFTALAKVVFEYQGTLIKFIGDAVFAIYGAPIPLENHAALACKTALGIQEVMKKFNETKQYPELITRIGINTGNMVVGNLGSVERFDYTAIGDSVNLASRLQGVNKYLGTYVLVSESVVKELKGEVEAILLAKVRVVGKSAATELYTLNDGTIGRELIQTWKTGLDRFWNQDFDEAREHFQKVMHASLLLSGVARIYLQEIAGEHPENVSFTWAGELVLEKK